MLKKATGNCAVVSDTERNNARFGFLRSHDQLLSKMADRRTNTKRASSTSKSTSNKKAAKKPLPDPTHIGHFILTLVIYICKKILHADTAVKIGVYMCGVLIGSVLADVIAFPKTYFSEKRNVLNRVFVRFGYGWTFVLLFSYIFLTSFVYTCGNWKLVLRKHLTRLALSTFWWLALTKTFIYVDSVVGVCSAKSITQKGPCLKAGKVWLGFDISGHVFLLMLNLLTISEEVKSFKFWHKLDSLLQEDDLTSKKNLTEHEISQARVSFKALTPYIKAVIILLTIWMVFCEFMLIISVLYRFHTLTQKVAAAFLAVGCWFVTYRVLLETKVDVFPSQPGESRLNFMKQKL